MIESHSGSQQARRPLEGIRIIDCGTWHAGPAAAAILGDLGADVIKLETLSGDPERLYGSFGPMDPPRKDKPDWTILFEITNRNKKGICVDINMAEGRSILHNLVKSADIFLTNIRQGSMSKLGIDYRTLSSINPKIIHVTVNGFGPKGPLKDMGGFDLLGQAISGMMYMSGPEEPALLQTVPLDQLTAITASHAMLTALVARERQGIGQEVHVSLYGSALWMMHVNLVTTSMLKENLQVKWDRLKNPALRNSFQCKDGKWILGCNHPEHKYWPAFCEVLGLVQLQSDPRFATPELRMTNIADLLSLADVVILTKTRAEWLKIFQDGGLLFAPIQEVRDVLEDPQALANDYVVDYDHPSLGRIRIPGYPVSFGANAAGTHAPAPDLGEHTVSVLSELGYSSQEIERLKTEKVVK